MNKPERRRTGRLFCLAGRYSLQIPHKKKIQKVPNILFSAVGRRVSLCASLKGSLTLEAALVLPLLLCSVTALLYLFAFTGTQARSYRTLTERAQTLAVTAGGSLTGKPYITLYDYQTAKLPFFYIFGGRKQAVQRVVARAWVGYTGETFSENTEEQMVYITPEGEVYHRSRDCTYLLLTVRSISAAQLSQERNQSGGKYAPCEYCVKNIPPGGNIYVTDYGTSYHKRRDCQGLKRTVMMVPYSEVAGMPCCSRCGGMH